MNADSKLLRVVPISQDKSVSQAVVTYDLGESQNGMKKKNVI